MADLADLPRPSQLWKQLSSERKQHAAEAFWKDGNAAMEHAEDALRGLGGAPGGGDVVDAIAAAAEQRAAEAERVDAEQWRDPGRLAALHDAVHAAVHHLRAATKALAAARQRR